jgi:aminoglycoside 6'-N-acetyltransferase
MLHVGHGASLAARPAMIVVVLPVRSDSSIEFIPVEPGHFRMLWEWVQRPHVATWFAFWMPPTREETIALWTAMVEGREAQRGYLMVVDGAQVGYIESSQLSQSQEMTDAIGLGHDAVAADLFIADPGLTGRGLGPVLVARFYLRLMDETGLDVGVIDPEVDNLRAIRAYEKAGFRFLKVTDSGEPRGRDHIMVATRAELEAALRQLQKER